MAYGMVRHGMYGMVWNGMAWHGRVWYDMVRHMAWYGIWHGGARKERRSAFVSTPAEKTGMINTYTKPRWVVVLLLPPRGIEFGTSLGR